MCRSIAAFQERGPFPSGCGSGPSQTHPCQARRRSSPHPGGQVHRDRRTTPWSTCHACWGPIETSCPSTPAGPAGQASSSVPTFRMVCPTDPPCWRRSRPAANSSGTPRTGTALPTAPSTSKQSGSGSDTNRSTSTDRRTEVSTYRPMPPDSLFGSGLPSSTADSPSMIPDSRRRSDRRSFPGG